MTFTLRCQATMFSAAMVVAAATGAVDRHYATIQENGGRTTLIVESPRPMAKAVEALVQRYGRVITYEDPRYAHDDDLEDVTARVRRDLAKYPPGEAPKVIGPRGGMLRVESSSKDVNLLLEEIVRAQSSRGQGGRFHIERTGDVSHVVPVEIRDRNGNWTTQVSILDTPISLPAQIRSLYDMVDAVCAAVTEASRVKVAPGTNALRQGLVDPAPREYPLEAENEPARSVLMRALDKIAADRGRLTWLLFYGDEVTDNFYVLNLMPVLESSKRERNQLAPRQLDTSAASEVTAPLR